MEIRVRDLEVADAPALSGLFRRCYGTTYGTPVFYDVDALSRLIAEGALRSVVAVAGDEIVGHTGITIRHPGARVCETGNTVVDPAARGQGLLRSLGRALQGRVLREGFTGYVHYPTTAHPIMQRASVTGGGVETGVMLAYIAETTEYAAVDRRVGRLAATVAYQPFRPVRRRTVTLPARYAALIAEIHARCALERDAASSAAAGGARTAELSSLHDPVRGLLRLFLQRPGADVGDRIEALMQTHGPKVTHLDLPLDDPVADRTVEQLASLGFFFCAVLPEFARTDVLRLQALADPVAEDFTPALVNADARAYVEFMRRDASCYA